MNNNYNISCLIILVSFFWEIISGNLSKVTTLLSDELLSRKYYKEYKFKQIKLLADFIIRKLYRNIKIGIHLDLF